MRKLHFDCCEWSTGTHPVIRLTVLLFWLVIVLTMILVKDGAEEKSIFLTVDSNIIAQHIFATLSTILTTCSVILPTKITPTARCNYRVCTCCKQMNLQTHCILP